jgi:hypothetical protein
VKIAVRPSDRKRAASLGQKLIKFDSEVIALPGIKNGNALGVLVEQIVDSMRRIEFVHVIRDSDIDPRRADPSSPLFDPIRAAAYLLRKGENDEAFWLTFLATHFGKHARYGWGLVGAVYAGSNGAHWTWKRVSANISVFKTWLSKNESDLGARYSFSNHRKYQSLSASSRVGTGAVIESYIKWVAPPRTHQNMIHDLHVAFGQNPRTVFGALYKSMDAVIGFGRLGKFDFLTMLGKLGIAPIEPGSAYLVGATGPLDGAQLLFSGSKGKVLKPRELEDHLVRLDEYLNVGMQVLEDSLCNWQKSPQKFISFKG